MLTETPRRIMRPGFFVSAADHAQRYGNRWI